MESSEDETMIYNMLLFSAVLEDKDIAEKTIEIEDILKRGADVNAADACNNDDTPLHVAIKRKEKDIVKLLLQSNADITRLNCDDKSALHLAKELKGTGSQAIKELIEEYAIKKHLLVPESITEPIESDTTKEKRKLQRTNTIDWNQYLKRNGTTGVRGPLYKTKMLSLILLRAANDPDIKMNKFFLGTNISGVEVFYDVCFKYHVKNTAKSIRLFMQCKHLPTEPSIKETDLRNTDGDWSLSNCLDGFLKIKRNFGTNINDPIFSEDFTDVECNFILYTSSKNVLKKKFYGNSILSPKIHYLINTGTNTSVFRYAYTKEDIDVITKEIQKKRIMSLAQCFIDFIFSGNEKYVNMMEDELIKTYHVVLAINVLHISGIQDECYRTASFRPHFFQTKDELKVLFKETLCKLTVNKYNKSEFGSEELVNLFNQLPNVPSSDEISLFIGAVVMYDAKNNKLKLRDDLAENGFSDGEIQELSKSIEQIRVTATTIKEAVLKAGEKKLQAARFKVPCSFGNMDLSIKLEEKDSVFENIASVFAYLFNYYRNTKVIELNETNTCKYIKSTGQIVTTQFLRNEDGIGSAIGNLLIPDNDAKTLKFNTAITLPKEANALLKIIKTVLPKGEYLESYRLKLDFDGCPRISFYNNDYDRTLAEYFLCRLWFYTDQEKEDTIDTHIKKEIVKYYNAHKGSAFQLCTHIDSIYSTFHDEIQKWWMVSSDNSYLPYLTQEDEIFRFAQEGVIDSPLLTLHHQMFLTKIKRMGISFSSDAIKNLQLAENTGRLVKIQTDSEILTGIKIHQLYKNKDNYNFMDLNYVLSLPPGDLNIILNELRQTTIDTLVIICGYSKPIKRKLRLCPNEDLNRIINIFKGRKVILVTANDFNTKLCIPSDHHLIQDKLNHFIQFDEDAKKTFAAGAKLILQGSEICLNAVLDSTSIDFINVSMLSKFINHERVEIGRIIITKEYEDIQHLYVPRSIERKDSEESYTVNSLDDIKDNVVVIITKHGMGKSTLLTHLALTTKKADPTRWIVRINLSEHFNDFYPWQKNKSDISKCDAIEFLCKASLKHVDRKTQIRLKEADGKIYLTDCNTMDIEKIFELKLFLHYYNERKIIFLFHLFDSICPPFGKEAIKMLKILENDGITMWITSHLIGVPEKMLEDHFGPSYKLRPVEETYQRGFFHKFWKSNMQLEKINSELCSNIWQFIEYMSGKRNIFKPGKEDRIATPWMSMPLHMLYLMAVDFFQTELSNFSFDNVNNKLKEYLDIDFNSGFTLGTYLDGTPEAKQAAELAGTPLHMYVAANYFKCKIQGSFKVEPDVPEIKKKWDLWRDAVSVYERFVQHNMKNVCCLDGSPKFDPDVEENKRKAFFERHKNLALLAICKEEDLSRLLPANKIDELKNTLSRIRNGEEKSAFVDCVLDGVPKFFHLMYAEYCAVEYLCDVLKGVQVDSLDGVRHTFIWDFIVNILLYTCSNSVRSAFDYKLKHDPEITEITSTDQCKKIIFELMIKNNSTVDHTGRDNSLQVAIDSGMNNLVKVLLTSLEVNLTKESVKSCVKVLQVADLVSALCNLAGGSMPTNVTQFFTDMRLDKFVNVLKSDHAVTLPLKFLSIIGKSEETGELKRKLTAAQRRLINRAQDRFGLSPDNIELFRRIAQKVSDLDNT